MFIDEVKVKLIAGKGGNGLVSYRQEKYVEYGGPWGGNGGRGGSIFFIGDENKSTLLDFKYLSIIKAPAGENGASNNCQGAQGEDTFLKVPLGTIIYNTRTNACLGEILTTGQSLKVAAGGKGGRGNTFFATNKNKCPDFAENGDLGEEIEVRLLLKMIADIGLIGLPSVGKSSIISTITNSKSKVADYPFTTLEPHLGVLNYYNVSISITDLPGLIEGASHGEGLGLEFLKHIERVRAFFHVLDASSEHIKEDYEILRNELGQYNKILLSRREIIVVNKIDLVSSETIKNIKKIFKGQEIIFISILRYENIELIKKIAYQVYNETKKIELDLATQIEEKINFEILKVEIKDNIFYVTGDNLKIQYQRSNLDNEYSLKRFMRIIRSMGIDDILKEKGAVDGDTINIYGFEFQYYLE
ncbi:MAG: GTPase ObgE [Acholeplasmatales bacterium]|jgi:GTP-binding protein|nr:GTPase ObgE [Acholeplasmatales bacterium]